MKPTSLPGLAEALAAREKPSLRELVDCYPRMLRLVYDASPRYAVLAGVTTILSGLTRPAVLWVSKLAIDEVARAVRTTNVGQAVDWAPTIALIAAIFAAGALTSVFQSLSESFREMLAYLTTSHTEQALLEKASTLDVAFFENSAFHDRLHRAQRDSFQARNIALVSIEMLGSFVSLVGMLVLLFRLHPLAVVCLLAASAPQALVKGVNARRQFELLSRRVSGQRMVSYLGSLLSTREPVKEVRLFQLEGVLLARYREIRDGIWAEMRRIRVAQAKGLVVWVLVSLVGATAIRAYAIVQAVLARITLGDLALVFQAVEHARNSLGSLFLGVGGLYEQLLFARSYFGFIDLSPDAVEGALRAAAKRADDAPRGRPLVTGSDAEWGIEFRNVTFRYPGTPHPVLTDVTFTLRRGHTAALVGENGAGKTTIVKLLARYYDPTEGVILLNGRDLRDYDIDSLRRRISVVFQDFVQYQLSARENIGFGDVALLADGSHIARAAMKGGATAVIEKLPRGLDTMLGRRFYSGVDLSGGEWQRLAISRAFMREADLLILDEPTGSLDTYAEQELHQRLMDLTFAKTTLFISHRFSTVRMADTIIVLERGRLIEQGTHVDLLAAGGKYAHMFNAQAERYH